MIKALVDDAIEDALTTGDLEDPAELEAQADALAAAAAAAIGTPGELFLESARKRARAAVLRQRSDAVEAVRAASEEVARCEEAYSGTEEPERDCAARAFEALQRLQRAHHDRVRAYDEQAPVAEIERLYLVIQAAEATVEGEDARVAAAVKAREVAYQDLEAARHRRRGARERLQQVEDALANPQPADLRPLDLYQSMMFTWPYRVMTAGQGTVPELSPAEREVCRLLASTMADVLGVIPTGAEAKLRASLEAEMGRQQGQVQITLPGGQTTTRAQLMGNVRGPGQAGRSW